MGAVSSHTVAEGSVTSLVSSWSLYRVWHSKKIYADSPELGLTFTVPKYPIPGNNFIGFDGTPDNPSWVLDFDAAWFFWGNSQSLRTVGNQPSGSFSEQPSSDWSSSVFEMRFTPTGLNIIQDGTVKYSWTISFTYPIYVVVDFADGAGATFENIRYLYE